MNIDRTGCPAPRHGRKADYHRRDQPCRCLDAIQAESRYRNLLRLGRNNVRSVPAIGCARRLQALAVIGWSLDDLIPHTGMTRSVLAVLRRGERTFVRRRTHHIICDTYERLSAPDQPGNAETIRRARLAGWAPPLLWEGVNIDDPDAQPLADEPAASGPKVRLDEVEHLLSFGYSLDTIAARFDVHPESIKDIRRRAARQAVAA